MGTVQIDGSTPKLTIGNATAEDATILFDGNAQDFYIALDDSADDLLIGLGSTVGTTPAIAIDENLKVNIPVTTASTSASTGSLTTGGGAGIGADLYVGDDAYLITDSAVLGFGADKDTLLTHTDGTGLTLNSTNKLCFNDASQFVQGSSATVLSIGATDEIDLTATAIDINGTCDISGTFSLGGTNITTTAAEINLIDGGTSRGTTAIADGDGVLINDAGTMRMTTVQTLSTYIGAVDGQPAIHVQAPDETAINHDTFTKVTLDTEVIDSGGTFTSDRWTPATAGTYFIYAQLYTATAGATNLSGAIAIYKNGSAGNAVGSEKYPNNDTSNSNFLYNTYMIDTADADDYYELYAKINCSGGSTINVSGYGKTFLGGFRIY